MALTRQELVDPVFFSRLQSIELQARAIVEGFLHGLHRSPYVGFSVEFSSHREYVPGDDPRHVNWKVFARQKRLYVKEYDADTNMNLYLMLDMSASMDCANAGYSKLAYGASLAAALAHLALSQRDAVGLTLFADTVVTHIAPRVRPRQLDEILHALTTLETRPTPETTKSLPQAVQLADRRGLVVIISDLLQPDEATIEALEHLRFKRHEALVFHVLDPWEVELPLAGTTRFQHLETGRQLTTQADDIQVSYRKAVRVWLETLEQECRKRAVERVQMSTDEKVDKALLNYLVKRAHAY